MKGKVYLVGAGPGDPELLTLKAARLLQSAEAVLYDDLVSPAILQLIPAAAQIHAVGKRCGTKRIKQEEINFLMVGLADSGLRVVRLKGGDPLIFGRAGEELEALRKSGIPYEIVPGVTSALGAAAAAGIPLTHRRHSSALTFVTAQQASDETIDWKALARSGATFVIYMPGHDHQRLSAKLCSSGLAPATPCVIVAKATTREQRIHPTTIHELGFAPPMPAPSLLIVGEVARFADAFESANYIASPVTPLAKLHASMELADDQEPVA